MSTRTAQSLSEGLGAEIATGSLTVGKVYRITAQDGEDFTADGAPNNNVGTTFLADDTNVTLDANDKVKEVVRRGIPD